MPQPIKLTYAEVVEAGRKAYLEKRLSAQGPTPACAYRDNSGRPCVIGAALTDKQAAGLYGSVWYLVDQETVVVPHGDLSGLTALQRAHDNWASANAQVDADAGGYERELRKLLNIEEAA